MNDYKTGKQFIILFYALVKSSWVYDPNNDVVLNIAHRLIEYLNNLLDEFHSVEILRYRDYIFFNKTRLRFEIEGYASLQFVEEVLKKLGIKSITLYPGLKIEEIIRFSSILKNDRESFAKEYIFGDYSSIRVEYVSELEEAPEFLKDGEQIKRTYFKSLTTTRNLIHGLWTRQSVDTKKFRRVIYMLIDTLAQDEFGLIALTTIKNFDEYTYNHSLNVGILSLAVGQRLDLEKRNLIKLGTAGLLHDIGKVRLSKELLYKEMPLTDEEWEILKLHSPYSVAQIIKTRGLDDIAMNALISAYQHHWNFDGTGYPEAEGDENRPLLFARIIRICDAYDAMTTSRPYQPLPYLPAVAIRVLWSKAGKFFDPILVKVFIQLMGVYPVSSCLELSTGEVGIVLRQNPVHLDLPIIKIVRDRQKQRIDGPIIDLSLDKKVSILKPVYPQQYGINPATYLL
ncbi:MAG: HD domain-containing phosphohydrolase [candidate division WOR-3 bacterium]